MRGNVGRVAVVALATGLSAVLAAAPPVGAVQDSEKLVGGGWASFGAPDSKVHLQANLPCPAAEVGFDPQPDAPGRHGPAAHLGVRRAGHTFRLDAVREAACSAGGGSGVGGTHQGSGTGTCDGTELGVIIHWRLTDGGAGQPDEVELRIGGGECATTLAGPLEQGNLSMVGGGRQPER